MNQKLLQGTFAALLLCFAPIAAGAIEFVDGEMPDPARVELGRALFFDKVLSGNQNISCATCHHPLTDTGDGLALPIGEGARGIGVTRDTGNGLTAVTQRVPRNAPPIFALGSVEATRLFHDGRIEQDGRFPSGFRSPAGQDLPANLDNILAVQAMFPVTSGTEMAGQPGENPIADQAALGRLAGPGGAWDLLSRRLRGIPGYVELFAAAFGVGAGQITFAHAANAIAAFEVDAWRADDSPWDRSRGTYGGRSKHGSPPAGPLEHLTRQQIRGQRWFFGKAGCSSCHSGELFSDMGFHAIAMPQIGPGKGNGVSGLEDWGRYLVTGKQRDRFKFRTPPLRNVALTAPYGHAGVFDSLEAVVRHHLDPIASLYAFNCQSVAALPSRADLDSLDCLVMQDAAAVASIAQANELAPNPLSQREIGDLVEFLHSLTDVSSVDLRQDVPTEVPSGLPLVE